MDKRRKTGKTIGWILVLLSAIMAIGMLFTSRVMTLPEIFAKQIQQSVSKAESEIQNLIDNGTEVGHYAKNGLGVFVYHNDSLLYWNDNAVGPRIIRRRVAPDSDTICNLLTGDNYVRSFSKGQLTYYVFRQINTTYKLSNQYFKNRYVLNNTLINNEVRFGTSEGFEITSAKGKLLSRCQITQNTQLRSPYREILYGIIVCLCIIGLLLITGRPKENKARSSRFKIEYGIGIIITLAVLFTYLYAKHNIRKENAEMQALAENLSEKRDTRFEKSFAGFAELVKYDTAFREMVFAESNVLAEVVLGYSKELLFDEIMNQYNTSLTLCEPNEEIAIQPEGYITDCEVYFLEKLTQNEQKRVGEGLYFIDYYTLDPNYLGKIKIYSADSLAYKTLYFEFYKPIAPEGFSFPQLLQETNSTKPYDYSVAHYRDNLLVYKYGKYVYPNFYKDLNIKTVGFTYEQGFKHYTKHIDNNKILVISTPRKGWSETTAPFAVFLLLMMVPYLSIYWFIQPLPSKRRSFRQRLQNVVFFTLAISFLAIGPVSVIYMRSLYNQKTSETQYETTRSIAAEMSNDIPLDALIENASRETWAEILQHYASNFFTDLNLYGLDGRLLATTRIEIFDLNLQAPMMNAEAYQAMHQNKALYYTHEERLGKGVYESAYIPLNDHNGNALAYLNTPYFTSATELHNEIRNFVLTYINIILILLAFALIFVINLTNRLTQPLSLIQSKLGGIKIDQKNEPIEWEGNDEIGALVKQYNQLIIELEKSAAELKRTTTESAWRGVARQVAHEIKNSLTPMRLSVQLLQRSIEKGDAHIEEKMQRTTATLIEQIDALSDIASSFSRYAKLPENHPAPLDLAELVSNVVNLYDNAENIVFAFLYDKAIDHIYNGDKTNLNSAVGNLIKNAVQAIGMKPDGKIEVRLEASGKAFTIAVKDNGKGIKDEDKSQIFLPNFTTKTGGSGVGLSLTYNIVQAAGGTISFKSQVGEGTEFMIELPKSRLGDSAWTDLTAK